ncbi:MAG: hypothetical protein ACREBV_01585 [Candidatus Zixiibacteriota bacterium]
MLSETEKAYFRALLALKEKDYDTAVGAFDNASAAFGTNGEFSLLYQSTRLLLEVRKEIAETAENTTAIEKELIING